MRFFVYALDRFLSRRLGIYEFTDDPRCVFRVRVARAKDPLPVPGGEVAPGSKILEIHFWNERVPPLPRDGATLSWGVKGYRMAAYSCRALAAYLRDAPELADVVALGGETVLFIARGEKRGKGIFPRLGFEVSSTPPSPLGRFGEFWENFHTWMIMWAYNAATLRDRRLLALERRRFWMRKSDFLQRYGGAGEPEPGEEP